MELILQMYPRADSLIAMDEDPMLPLSLLPDPSISSSKHSSLNEADIEIEFILENGDFSCKGS